MKLFKFCFIKGTAYPKELKTFENELQKEITILKADHTNHGKRVRRFSACTKNIWSRGKEYEF